MATPNPPSPDRSAGKRFDAWGQLFVLLGTAVYWLSVMDEGLGGALSFILIYLLVGAWQAISVIVWAFLTPWRRISAGRKFYLMLLLVGAILILPKVRRFGDEIIVLTMVYTGVLALFYLGLSFVEVSAMRREQRRSAN